MSLGKRIYAFGLERFMGRYERLIESRKRELLGGLRGVVVEIGPGTGSNLRFYDRTVLLTAVEPNRFMHPYLKRKAKSHNLDLTIVRDVAEGLPAPSNSVDAVVSTLVLCSVPDPARVLSEIQRVLKPGGRFVFIEHTAADPGTITRSRQEWIRPVWRCLADGCNPNRETWREIDNAGFREANYERFRLDLPIIGPHLAGVAVK